MAAGERTELSQWLTAHRSTIENHFQGRVFGPSEVPEADVLLLVDIEGHERFGQIGRLHYFEFTEDIGGNNLFWLDFPDGERTFIDGLQASKGGLRHIYIPLLTEADRRMLIGCNPAAEIFLQV